MKKDIEFSGVTVGELIRQLKFFDEDLEIQFGGEPGALTFYRTKHRRTHVQIEFGENILRSEDPKKFSIHKLD